MKRQSARPPPQLWVACYRDNVKLYFGYKPLLRKDGNGNWAWFTIPGELTTYQESFCRTMFNRCAGTRLKPGQVRRLKVKVEK